MKKLSYVLLLIFFHTHTFAQSPDVGQIALPFDENTQCYYYSIIDTVKTPISDSLIYNRIKLYLSEKYNNGNFPIDIPCKEIKLTGKTTASIENHIGKKTITTPVSILYDIDIEFKGNRYRIYIDMFRSAQNLYGFGQELLLNQYFKHNIEMIDIAMTGSMGIGKKKAIEEVKKSNSKISQKIKQELDTLVAELKKNAEQGISTDEW